MVYRIGKNRSVRRIPLLEYVIYFCIGRKLEFECSSKYKVQNTVGIQLNIIKLLTNLLSKFGDKVQ